VATWSRTIHHAPDYSQIEFRVTQRRSPSVHGGGGTDDGISRGAEKDSRLISLLDAKRHGDDGDKKD